MPTPNGHGQTSSEYERLLRSNADQHQSQPVGEMWLRRQRPAVEAVHNAWQHSVRHPSRQSVFLSRFASSVTLVQVQGACLIAATGRSRVLKFNPNVVSTLSSLMIIAAVALILPTALYSTFPNTSHITATILSCSRATACVLLLVYIAYLSSHFGTHPDAFVQEAAHVG